MKRNYRYLLLSALMGCGQLLWAAEPIRALIIDGQNNHKWMETTPVLKQMLEETGLFKADVLTSPPKGADMSGFHPEFSKYRVIVSNYNGDPWPDNVKAAFEKYMREGGGLVVYHAADNAFPEWVEWNRMTGLGGWGNRNEKSGPYWFFKDGRMVPDSSPGRAGEHGARIPFQVTVRDAKFPITKGLPKVWMHEADELYCHLRGPGKEMTPLATAFSDPNNKGSGRDEPMLFTIRYGKGRVFHTVLGHDVKAMSCVGFIATLQRGTEWAATGKVTQKVPADFPTADHVSTRALKAPTPAQ